MSTPTGPVSTELSKWEDKFDLVLRWYKDESGKVTLPALLETQRVRWAHIYGLLSSGKFAKDTQIINAILRAYPGVTTRTAYNYLRDTRRFYAVLGQPDLDFEKVMLINDLKDDIRIAKKRGDFRSLAALRKVYAGIIGADKATDPVENKTIINILNYNPIQLGGEEIDDGRIDRMVAKLLADDKKQQQREFEQYDDVSD